MRYCKFFLLILSVFITVSCGSGGNGGETAEFRKGDVSVIQRFTEDGISHTLGSFEEDGDGIPVTEAPFNQNAPEVVYLNGHNLWLVAWEDERNANTPGMGTDIYAHFVRPDGTLCGAEFPVASINGMQVAPKVAFNDVGNVAVIAWQDSRGTSTGGFVYFKTLTLTDSINCSSPGLGVEKTFGYQKVQNEAGIDVASDYLRAREKPAVVYNSQKDEFTFVWVERRNHQHYVKNDCFNTGTVDYQFAGNNEYLGFSSITTANIVNASPFTADYVRTADTSSNLHNGYTTMRIADSRLNVNPETAEFESFRNIQNPEVACSSITGECVIAFEAIKTDLDMSCDDNNGVITVSWTVTDGTLKHIYATRTPNLISTSDIEEPVNDTNVATIESSYPTVGFDSNEQRFLVAWERHMTSVEPKIMGQILHTGSGKYSGNFNIGEDTERGQTLPHISYDTTNQRFLVTWEDSSSGAVSLENVDIFGQFVNGAGSKSGNNFHLTTNQYNQLSPSTAYNSESQMFLSVWKDARDLGLNECGSGSQPCGSDIYAIRYALGMPQITLLNSSDAALTPAQIDFGTINTDTTVTKSFKIENSGDDVLHVRCFSDLTAPFSYVNLPSQLTACDGNYQNINPRTTQTYNVRFSPTSHNTYTSTMTIQSDAGTNRTIYLTGSAQHAAMEMPDFTTTNNTLRFDNVTVNSSSQKSFRITNDGQVNYTIESINFASPFTLNTALPVTMEAGSTKTFQVTFAPTSAGNYNNTVTVTTDTTLTGSFNVSGRGLAASDGGDNGGDNGGDGGTGGDDDDGEPSGGCSAGGSANLPIALFALAGIAKVMMRRKEQE